MSVAQAIKSKLKEIGDELLRESGSNPENQYQFIQWLHKIRNTNVKLRDLTDSFTKFFDEDELVWREYNGNHYPFDWSGPDWNYYKTIKVDETLTGTDYVYRDGGYKADSYKFATILEIERRNVKVYSEDSDEDEDEDEEPQIVERIYARLSTNPQKWVRMPDEIHVLDKQKAGEVYSRAPDPDKGNYDGGQGYQEAIKRLKLAELENVN